MKHPKSGKSRRQGREFSDYFVKAFSIQEFKLVFFFGGFNQSHRNIFLNADYIRAYVYSTIVQLMFHFRANSNKHLNDDNVFELYIFVYSFMKWVRFEIV